jgi:peptidyl-prolyl cis-trans isomerase C
MVRRIPMYLILLATVMCGTASAQQGATPVASKPEVNEEETDLVVARVSGRPITEKQVVEVIDQLASQKRMSLDQLRERNTLLFKDAVDNLVTIALLKNQAQQQHVTVDKAAVDQQLQQISQRFSSREQFQKALAAQSITEADLRKNVEESITLQLVIDEAVKDVPGATEEDVKKFYDENPEKFEMQERVHAAHILLRVDAHSTPEQKAEIKKELEGIRADIESKAITFAEAAAKYSQDPSNAQKGGDLGFFTRGQMVKPFEEAAFTTQPGTLSPIVETQFGYHIIQVIEVKPAGKASLEEAKADVKRYLDQMDRRKASQKFVDELKAKATIEMFMTQDEFAKRHAQN